MVLHDLARKACIPKLKLLEFPIAAQAGKDSSDSLQSIVYGMYPKLMRIQPHGTGKATDASVPSGAYHMSSNIIRLIHGHKKRQGEWCFSIMSAM